MNRGRNSLHWPQECWDRIDKAVHDETKRIKIAARFLPLYGPMAEALTTPSDTVVVEGERLFIDEAATVPLVETWVEFALTPQQVEREMELMSACTLAIRATNYLSQAQDLLLFQGNAAFDSDPLFRLNQVKRRSGPPGSGLFNAPSAEDQTIEVRPPRSGATRFAEATFEAVADAYARLQDRGHYGPYALVLHTVPHADTYAPLPTTLITPADRIMPLVACGFFSTGTLPALSGLLLSLGGNSMDLVVGKDATTAFMQEDPDGKYRFRVYERFALRLKDPSAIVKLVFRREAP